MKTTHLARLRTSPLTALRRGLNLGIAETAIRLGLSPTQVQYLEDHTRRFEAEHLANIAVLLMPAGSDVMVVRQWLAEHRASATTAQAFRKNVEA